jgi:hypothetical protein
MSVISLPILGVVFVVGFSSMFYCMSVILNCMQTTLTLGMHITVTEYLLAFRIPLDCNALILLIVLDMGNGTTFAVLCDHWLVANRAVGSRHFSCELLIVIELMFEIHKCRFIYLLVG